MDSPVALIAVSLLAAGALALPSARARAASMLAALALAPVILVAHIWDSEQLGTLRDRPSLAAAAIVLGAVVLVLAARLLHRRPELFPLAVVAAIPFRVPISAGGSTANLLLPLYLVVAAGALAWAVPKLQADRPRDGDPEDGRPGAIPLLLAATLVLYAAQTISSAGRDDALEQIVFFYVPFAILFALLVRVEWTPSLLRRVLGVGVALAVALVAVGGYEFATKTLLLNPDVVAEEQFEDYFRVQSLFFDPNIYGRFLSIVMLGLAAVMLWARRPREVWVTVVLLAILWGGLVLTLSQSSFTGLVAGLAVLAGLRWSPRIAAGAVAAVAVAGVVVLLAAPDAVNVDIGDSKSAENATSGRIDLIEGGVELAADRPFLGWGSGSFSREYRRQEKVSSRRAQSASHTIPVTIAAEQGAAGLLLYLALIGAALWTLLRGASRSVARAAVGAGFVALVVHTMIYAAFLEDPLAWALLAVGAALAATRSSRPAEEDETRDARAVAAA